MKRPSHRELSGKIKTAKKAVAEDRIRLLNRAAMVSDALESGYLFEDDFLKILSDLLDNTKPEHYTGTTPPQRSYEEEINGMELFAFKVMSKILDLMIYYKFSIKNNCCYVVSLHKDREKE
ncbi:MAG: hypothetical protein JRG68_09485 [Deltaproteobacteria bacterium]|nr:hypothetical protein [Deltaproteobacteria bacterium]MBW2011378.1 hypothetical protein [Deltaproteobacteria bacterium]MBW2100965.1 hypothetical protein [Deltaproteobacteria bacterium]